MKKSKRMLASLMSVLLVLPSLVLPFSATAENEEESASDQRIVAVIQEEESTGTGKKSYWNSEANGGAGGYQNDYIGKQWSGLDISLTKASSNYMIVGEYKLNMTDPVQEDTAWIGNVLGSGNVVVGSAAGGTNVGQMKDIIPASVRVSNDWMPFEIPLTSFPSDTITYFQLNPYNDMASDLQDQETTYTLDYAVRRVYVMDMSIQADGTPNPVVADISGAHDVVTEQAQGTGTPNPFPGKALKTNSMSADMDASKLRVEFDVMYSGEIDATKVDSGLIRLWVHDLDGDHEYNSPAWSGPVEETDTWYHISYTLDQFTRTVEDQKVTIADPSAIYQALIFDYNHNEGTPAFTTHVKNFRIVDTEMERLEAAVDQAEAKLADGKTYTDATLAALNEKLTTAKALGVEATQAQVTEAADALASAIEGLQEETAQEPQTYPNADPDELYYVVGRFQEKDAVVSEDSVVNAEAEKDADKASDPTITIDATEPIDLSAYGADRSKLALMLDVKVDRKDGETGKDALKSTANQFVELQDLSDPAAQKSVFKTSGSSRPYLGAQYTNGYEDAAGEWVTYIVPWSLTLSENTTDKVTRFFYGMYNDTTDVALTISIRNARIVDFTRDGEGYANGVVALMYGQTMDATADGAKHNQNNMEVFTWAEPLVNSLTAEMDPANLRLEFETKAAGEGQSSNIVNGSVQLQCGTGDNVKNYQVNSWSNGRIPQNDTWYSFSYTLDTLKENGQSANAAMTDPSQIAKFHVYSYNDNKIGTSGQADEELLVMNQIIRNARIIDLTVVQPREDLEVAINELNDCLFEEDAAAEKYDAEVAKGKALLADRNATPEDMTAQVEAINTAKASLSNLEDVTYEVAHFSNQEKTMNVADVNATQFYYNWSAADGTTDAGIDMTDGSENVIGANRYFQLKVTFARNTGYQGTTTFEDIDILNNVQVRLRSSDVEGKEHRSDSFTLAVTDKQEAADQVVYTLEGLLNNSTEATGNRMDMNWKDLRSSIIFVNVTSPLWVGNENKSAPVAIECTLSDVQIVNKTREALWADLTAAVSDTLENESFYTADTLQAFKDAQAAAGLVLADETATPREVRAAAKAVTDAKASLALREDYLLIGYGPATSNEGHDFGAAIEAAQAVDLTPYADRDLSITYKIKVDKTEQFPTSDKIEGNNWLKYIRNGSFKVNGENVTDGRLSLSKGIYSGVTETGVWVDVTVALPKGTASISKVEARFFNDLHSLTGVSEDQNHGVTISIKDAYVVVGDVSPVARWSGKTGEYACLLYGTRLYTDWGAQVDGGTVDLSDDSENNVANPNYALSATIQVNLKGESVQGKTLTDVMDKLEYRLRTDGSSEAQFYTVTPEEMHIEGNVVTILSPLTNVTTGNMKWNDVRGLNMGYYVKAEYQNKNVDTGKLETANPWDQVTMTLSEVKVVKMEQEEPEPTPVDKEALAAKLEAARTEAAKTGTYTAGSVAALNAAITAAQEVYDSNEADQNAVNAQVTALQTAIDALVDLTALNAAIASAQTEAAKTGTYTTGSVAALNTAITAAQGVAAKENATKEEVAAQVTALQSAVGALVDISGLKTLLDGQKDAEQLEGYTAASVEAYNALFTAAQAVYNNGSATREQVAEQVELLEGAEAVLVPKPQTDKQALAAKLEAARTEAAKTGTYTAGSVAALNTAITAAQEVYDSDEADQNAVNAQVTALQTAIDALVDLTALKAAIASAQTEAAKTDTYTEDSLEQLNTAISAAQGVAAKENATKEEVAAQVTALENAVKNLQPLEQPVLGDLTGDGEITALDALIALQAATNKLQLSEEMKALADVDGNGEVTAADALLILQVSTKTLSGFGPAAE